MIKSFGDKATPDLFHGISSGKVRKPPTQILESATYKLDILNAATSLNDLRSPPGNRLEALRGDYKVFIAFESTPNGESYSAGRISVHMTF